MNYSPQILKQRFDILPNDLQGLILSTELPVDIKKIGLDAGLTIDQINGLADEVGLVIFGLNSPSNFGQNIMSRLSIDALVTKKIADQIGMTIFRPIQDSLNELGSVNVGADTTAASIKKNNKPINPPSINIKPETDPDHLLFSSPTPIEISGKTIEADKVDLDADENKDDQKQKVESVDDSWGSSSLSTEIPVFEPPRTYEDTPNGKSDSVKTVRTLEEDFDSVVKNKEAEIANGLAAQKLKQMTSLPKEQKNIGVPATPPVQYGHDGKRIDPYREQI